MQYVTGRNDRADEADRRTVVTSRSSGALFEFKKRPRYLREDGYVIGYNVHSFKKDTVSHALLLLGLGFGALLISIL
jgi:hypothetical protein